MGLFKKRKEKIEAKKEIKLARIAARASVKIEKEESKQVAYNMGIDPNAAKWQGIGAIATAAGGVASSFANPASKLGGLASETGEKKSLFNNDEESPGDETKKGGSMIWVGLGILLVWLMLKKK